MQLAARARARRRHSRIRNEDDMKRLHLIYVLASLSGCATVTPDGGFHDVAATTQARIGVNPQLARDADGQGTLAPSLRDLPVFKDGAPLDMDTAVRIALVNHPGLQATYWNVGIAQADLAQAARPRNPSFDFKRLAGGGALEIERGITFDLVGLLTTPLAARMEARRFEQVKRDVGAAIERHALETRTAWIAAVASRQALDYARRVLASSEAGAELAGRMAKAGNTNQLELAREQVFHAQAAGDAARADKRAAAARERLVRALGLAGKDTAFTLPDHLPDLPAAPAELQDVERIALAQRLDVQAAQADAAATAADLGLTRTTRFVNVLDAGYAEKSDTGAPKERGYSLSLEVPLFDWGGARVARAEAAYMQSVNRVRLAAVTARSEARASYRAYRNAYDVARQYRDTILPLRKKIGHEVLLRYNGMLASPQDLLADARAQAEAVGAYIEALETFWTAHAELEATLGTRLNKEKAE
jgi:outer membrane protein TolC